MKLNTEGFTEGTGYVPAPLASGELAYTCVTVRGYTLEELLTLAKANAARTLVDLDATFVADKLEGVIKIPDKSVRTMFVQDAKVALVYAQLITDKDYKGTIEYTCPRCKIPEDGNLTPNEVIVDMGTLEMGDLSELSKEVVFGDTVCTFQPMTVGAWEEFSKVLKSGKYDTTLAFLAVNLVTAEKGEEVVDLPDFESRYAVLSSLPGKALKTLDSGFSDYLDMDFSPITHTCPKCKSVNRVDVPYDIKGLLPTL